MSSLLCVRATPKISYGSALSGGRVKALQAMKLFFGEAENFRNVAHEVELGWMNHAIRFGDMKQSADQFFKHRRFVLEHISDLAGIGFEAFRIVFRFIEDTPDGFYVLGGDVEHFLKRIDFVACDDTVRFSHFCRKHDNSDGESDLFGGV